MNEEENEKKKLKKTVRIPKIMLIYPNGSVETTILEEAEKIAKRRNLELRMVSDPVLKSNKDVYKLYTSDVYVKEKENIFNEETTTHVLKYKSLKVFPIYSKICEHDLKIKLNNINKLLKKKHKVKLLIFFSTEEKETLLHSIKKEVKGSLAEEKPKSNSTTLLYHPLLDSDGHCPEDNIDNTKEILD
ncbi:uncharacterized protein LOC143177591 isoform X2 [Calliopsis andreniformis]